PLHVGTVGGGGVGGVWGTGSIVNWQFTTSLLSRSTVAFAPGLSMVVPPSGSVQVRSFSRQPDGTWAVTGHAPRAMLLYSGPFVYGAARSSSSVKLWFDPRSNPTSMGSLGTVSSETFS